MSAQSPSPAQIMTTEEVLSMYGDVPLTFSGYYKYVFTFSGKALDGAVISLDEGGNHHDIYRYNCTPTSVRTLNGGYASATVMRDGAQIWYDYE